MRKGLAQIAGAIAGASPVFFGVEYVTGHYTRAVRPGPTEDVLVFLTLIAGATAGALGGDYLFDKVRRADAARADYDEPPADSARGRP
ncbi:MAG TPA: hypothetical protein VM597_10250 [Gemmataceae bacterium]|jgi:hypothetical protein|nr:hypothetical protein [Gemmataceae bacterium]